MVSLGEPSPLAAKRPGVTARKLQLAFMEALQKKKAFSSKPSWGVVLGFWGAVLGVWGGN